MKLYTHTLSKKFRKKLDVVSDYLSSGRPKNFEEYQRLVGKIEGLSISKELLQEAEKRFIED